MTRCILKPLIGLAHIRDQLNRADIPISRDRVRRLMRKLGIHAIYRKPRNTIPEQDHKVYPYLLRDLVIDRPNQVGCADVTYNAIAWGFLYLMAVMDCYSRKVLAWRLSNTLTVGFCWPRLRRRWRALSPGDLQHRPGMSVHQRRIHRYAQQRRRSHQYERPGWLLDNMFSKRLWRTIKYEEVYLHAYETLTQAQAACAVTSPL